MGVVRIPLVRDDWRLGESGGPVAAWHHLCDTEAELPTATNGCTAITLDSGKYWKRSASAWQEVGGGAAGAHTHPISEIVGLQAALDAKQDAGGFPIVTAIQTGGNISTGANTTPITVPGCVFSFVATGIYFIELIGLTQAAATTTGHGFQFDTSVAVSFVGLTFDHPLSTAGTLTGGYSIADDASAGVSSGRPTANVNVMHKGAGMLIAGANAGTAQLRFRSEVAAVATTGGNILRVQRVA